MREKTKTKQNKNIITSVMIWLPIAYRIKLHKLNLFIYQVIIKKNTFNPCNFTVYLKAAYLKHLNGQTQT